MLRRFLAVPVLAICMGAAAQECEFCINLEDEYMETYIHQCISDPIIGHTGCENRDGQGGYCFTFGFICDPWTLALDGQAVLRQANVDPVAGGAYIEGPLGTYRTSCGGRIVERRLSASGHQRVLSETHALAI